MGHVICTKDKKAHTVFGIEDLWEIVSEYAGYEVRDLILEELTYEYGDEEELKAEIKYLEESIEGLKEHYRAVMTDLRKQSEVIAGIICKPEIDRKALSNAAGTIGAITGRECR